MIDTLPADCYFNELVL